MPEARSSLHDVIRPGRFGPARPDEHGLVIAEHRGRRIVQVTAWQETRDPVYHRIRSLVSVADAILDIGGARFWIVSDDPDTMSRLGNAFGIREASVLDLSHSRTCIALEGPSVRRALAKGVPLDLHPAIFREGEAAQTVVDHVGILIRRTGTDRFELFVPRSYAVSLWAWLTESAAEFGYEVI